MSHIGFPPNFVSFYFYSYGFTFDISQKVRSVYLSGDKEITFNDVEWSVNILKVINVVHTSIVFFYEMYIRVHI